VVRIPGLSEPASSPYRIAKTCVEYRAVFHVFSSGVWLTPDSAVVVMCHLSALPVKLCRADLCVLYDFFNLKPIGNFTGDVFSVRRDFLRA
jgi:hypothetical protein